MSTPATLWQQLESRSPEPVLLTMLPCLTGPGVAPVFAGLLRTAAGDPPARLLLLRVPRYLARNTRLRDQPRGLVLEPVEHPDDPALAYVSLRLTEPELGDLFAVLAYDIVETVAVVDDCTNQLKTFLDRIAGWQELFGRVPAGGLTAIARQGLYGELFMVRRLLAAGRPVGEVAAAWVGPLREPQDFRFGAVALEVKTTTGAGQAVHVSNAAQLDDAPLAALWLYHLSLTVAPDSGETLPELVSSLTDIFRAEASAAAHFQSSLQLAGYFHAQSGLYTTEGFMVRHEHTFRVTGAMPRLRASDIPAAIGSVNYTVELAALLPYRHLFSELTSSLP